MRDEIRMQSRDMGKAELKELRDCPDAEQEKKTENIMIPFTEI